MNIKKALTVLLILTTSLFVLTGCGGDEAEPTFPTDPLEIITYGITDSMEMMQDEASNSVMDFSSYFGLEDSDFDKPQLKVTFNTAIEDTELNIFYESLNNSSTGEASLTLGLEANGEKMDTAVAFTGNDMIMRFYNTEEPMVKYTMPAEKASSIVGINPMERYVSALDLLSDDPSEVEDTFDSDISNMNTSLSDNLTSEEVITSEETITIGGEDIAVTAYSVTASDAAASGMLSSLFNALNNDSGLNEYMSTLETSEDDSPEALSSIEDIAKDEAKLAQVQTTIKVFVQGETVLGCYMTFDTPDGKVAINNKYQISGDTKDITMETTYPGGFSTVMHHAVKPEGEGINDTTTYDISDNGKKSTIIQESFIKESGDDYLREFSVTGEGLDSEDADMSLESLTGKYEATKSGSTVNGTFSGKSVTVDPEEGTQTFEYSGTTLISEENPEISIPAFKDNSGVAFTDVDKLKNYLNQDSEAETSNYDNQYEANVTALIWMLRIGF